MNLGRWGFALKPIALNLAAKSVSAELEYLKLGSRIEIALGGSGARIGARVRVGGVSLLCDGKTCCKWLLVALDIKPPEKPEN